MSLFNEVQRRVQGFIPFTALNTLLNSLDRQPDRVLDVGCGEGSVGPWLRKKGVTVSVGADVFLPYLRKAQEERAYNYLVRCDARHLSFRDKSFDIVISMSLLEHLGKPDGFALLAAMERIAKKRVVITVPIGDYEQHEYDENPHQEHLAVWYPEEMRGLGYSVRGAGLRHLAPLAADQQSPLPWLLKLLAKMTWILSGPIAWMRPEWGGYMVCTKRFS
jgi:SAM-dependent methyltransferase